MKKRRRRVGVVLAALAVAAMLWLPAARADDDQKKMEKLEDVVVKEKTGPPGMEVTPSKTVIDVEAFSTIGMPDSILDVLKTQAIVDFRGESDLDPGIDSIFLRGFDSERFVTAIDNLTVQKTGGRKSSNIVDYSLLPAFLIEKVEILPGPHWAMYDAKAIGGVLNFISQAPKRRDTLKPDVSLSTSYSSYETWSSNATVRGAVSDMTYDLAYKQSRTDGYLRNGGNDMETVYGRFGFILPEDGFVTFSSTYSDVDRQAPVHNPASDGTDYDSGYPVTTGGLFDPYQDPTWDSTSYNFRLNYAQSLPVGRLSMGAYFGKDNRDRAYLANKKATTKTHMDTEWWQQGGKIQDEITWSPEHVTTAGFDLVQMYDDGIEDLKNKRIDKNGSYLQHRWSILPSLDLTVGARYEDLNIWITSGTAVTERHFDQLIPKSFATWKMDSLASWLRDTSLSAGASKIWHAPDAHGIYNPQGRPLGLTLEPEHGRGYDLILDRRLWRDITVKIDGSFYELDDFIASSTNVDKVHRYGLDLELGGHIIDPLSFYLTYAWQDFKYKGDDATGAENVDQRAEHRIGAGLRYDLFETTQLQLDWSYQSDEITELYEEDPATGYDILVGQQLIEAYHVVDLGVRQTLFKRFGAFSDGTLSVYVKNLFDEAYYNSTGWPAIDRTYGITFSVNL